MNRIALDIEHIENKIIDGIVFRDRFIVKLFIDNNDCFEYLKNEGLVYFSELEKSKNTEGKFLIFTGANGIADDAGWEMVKVSHKDGMTYWKLILDNFDYNFSFNQEEYVGNISRIKQLLDKIERHKIEPLNVIFPE